MLVDEDWCSLWRVKIPPKVKHFVWRICREVFPTRSNLRRRHMVIGDTCPWCDQVPESTLHLVIYYSKAQACWMSLGMLDVMMANVSGAANFCAIFFPF